MSTNKQEKPQCCCRVSTGSWGMERQCERAGSLEYDGENYCKTHHPPSVKARDEERMAAREEKWRRGKLAQKQEADKEAERNRKSAEYDELKAQRDELLAASKGLLASLFKVEPSLKLMTDSILEEGAFDQEEDEDTREQCAAFLAIRKAIARAEVKP